MGANVAHVVTLLSKDFVKLVLLAIVLSTPLTWYAASHWLKGFVYRIDLSLEIFMIAGGIAICIALFTVSFQSIKAALANPVKSLKAE